MTKKAIFVDTNIPFMPRTKGSANRGNLPRTAILKVRISEEFKAEIEKALNNQMYKRDDLDTSQFVRDAITRHILYTAKDIELINRDHLG